MDGDTNGLIRRAESLGIRLGYEFGFTTARMPATGDAEQLEGTARLLCKNLEDVARVTMERASSVRALEFVGRPAFATDRQVLATIDSLSSREAIISYHTPQEEYATAGVEAASLLIAATESEDARPPSGFPVEMRDEVRLLVQKIESSGIRFVFLDGFMIASSASGGRDTLKTIKDLGTVPRPKSDLDSYMEPRNLWPQRMQEIRRLAIARARGFRGKEFVGRTAIANIDASSTGLDPRGTITGCGEDGMLVLSSYSELAHCPREFRCSADRVLILRDAERPEQLSASRGEADRPTAPARRRWPFGGGEAALA